MISLIGILLFTLSAFLTSIGHILIKKGIKDFDKKYIYLNKEFIIAGLIFSAAIFISINGYKYIDLKYGIILSSLNYVFIIFLSKIILKETFSTRASIGIFLIMIGISIFSLN